MSSFNFVIRDAMTTDVDACLGLDHTYETDYVWKMSMQTLVDGHRVSFRKERLPRPVTIQHQATETRLRLALPKEQCFLVAVGKDDPIVLGYASLRPDPIHKIGLLQDIVVAKDFRGFGIGTRLLTVVRRWASEHGAEQLMIEVPTTNFPAIQFLQNRGLRFCGFNDQYFRNQDISVFFGQSIH